MVTISASCCDVAGRPNLRQSAWEGSVPSAVFRVPLEVAAGEVGKAVMSA